MKNLFLLFCLLVSVMLLSCTNKAKCYDKQMEEDHSGICTQDCPQVCGCDGETYCNECIANSHGISVDYNGPCK